MNGTNDQLLKELAHCPSDWVRTRFKLLGHFVGGGTPSKDNAEYWSGDVPWVSPKDMGASRIVDTIDHISREAVVDSSTAIIPPHSLLFVVRSGILQHTIPAAINEIEVSLNQDMRAFIPRAEILSVYLLYIIQGCQRQLLLAWRKAGATVESLESEYFKNFTVPVPPIDRQHSICDFLDRKTAQIDDLIAKKQRLIDLLQEKRQALISHAVTKGLNPDAPMKDSGIEWLGEVPAHWQVRRIASVSDKITNGYVGPTRGLFVDDGVTYLQSLHIKDNGIVFTPEYFVTHRWSSEHGKSILREGDVLVVQTGDIGQVAVVPTDYEGANCHALIIIAARQNECHGPFLSWVLNSNYGFHSLKSIQTGALHPHLNCTFVREIKVPLPPENEQDAIVNVVRTEVHRTSSTTDALKRQIAKLYEYRQTLISAAVTGKIDVRQEVAA